MTAEVAVLNKTAVALACDSAATMSYGDQQKFNYSSNKLFALSKYHPVGVMVYGNSEFMRMPWENIIKSYRRKLGQNSFRTLEQYAGDFVEFLKDKDGRIFPSGHETICYLDLVTNFLTDIRQVANQSVLEEGSLPTEQRIKEIITQAIKENLSEWDESGELVSLDDGITELVKSQNDEIIKRAKYIFGESYLTDEAIGYLQSIAKHLITKDSFTSMRSGLVMAGFGEDENFPSIISHELEFKMGDKLKITRLEDKSDSISYQSDAWIVTFAQEDVVGAFMEGIDGEYRGILLSRVHWMLEQLSENITPGKAKPSGDKEKNKVEDNSKKKIEELMEDLLEFMSHYTRKHHIDPIVYNIGNLPKDELAQIAESLVNITSFKRRVSTDAETVGGPIDVAVISKGDGFIWIKRKHYFKPELNPQFFENYKLD